MSNRRGAILPGILLVLFGAFLLARNLDVPLPGMEALWPAILVVFGLGFLAQYLLGGRREEGLVFAGTAATLLGALFAAITLGPLSWEDLGRYWPVFVLIGGTAFLAQWLARPGQRGLLVPAALALLVGGAALAMTLGRVNRAVTQQMARWWPVALILAGLSLVISYLVRARRSREGN